MTVATLILQLQQMAQLDDEVTLIIEDGFHEDMLTGIFTGKVIGTGTGAKTGTCEIYGMALRTRK